MTVSPRTPCLLHEPFDDYRARAGQYLTSHLLADFRRCPLLYHRKRAGLIPDEDRPAFVVGRAAHTLILEGKEAFQRSYVVGGPINPKTGMPFGPTTKAFAEWAERQDKEVLTDAQFEVLSRMHDSIRQHPAAAMLLAEGEAEGVVRAGYGLPCQIRMDWFEPHLGIVDLKTCDDLGYFEADARRWGYVHQLAFYRAVLAQVIGVFMPTHLIAVEKKEPYRCGVWKIAADPLVIAQQENEAAIGRLRTCLQQNTWPTGFEDVRLFDFI